MHHGMPFIQDSPLLDRISGWEWWIDWRAQRQFFPLLSMQHHHSSLEGCHQCHVTITPCRHALSMAGCVGVGDGIYNVKCWRELKHNGWNLKWYLGHMGVWHVAVIFLQKHRNVLQCSLVMWQVPHQDQVEHCNVCTTKIGCLRSNRVESVSSEQSFSNCIAQDRAGEVLIDNSVCTPFLQGR